MERRLAAVFIADVVGYGRLSRIDEEGTRARFQADMKDLFEPRIGAYHGRLVKTMGDGLLVEFPSVVDALHCAVEIQRTKAERNSEAAPAQRLDFRIGVNLGDIIVEGDDIHGDGVNIADRLQGLAEPGGIAISGSAYDQVKGKLPVGFVSLGEQNVKSIEEPVRVYRVSVDPAMAGKTLDDGGRHHSWRVRTAAAVAFFTLALGLVAAWWSWEPATQPADPGADGMTDARPSIVVLPFDNLSDDKEQGYLADGFTEDLTTELARIPGLFVISRNAAFAYRDKETKPAEIARELGVRYLLEGSIRRVGNDMRINAQLIDGSTAGHVWAERFEGQWADIFALQDKVLDSIAGALKLRLTSSQASPNFAGGTDNLTAYEAYLRGMEIYNRPNTPEEFAEAVQLFQQAVRLDPDFGAAFAQLAWAYWDATEPRAKALGISVDEANGRVAETLQAAARHPSPSYYQLTADLLVREHRSDEAVALLHKSVALNPSDPWNYLGLANALNFNGRPREARDYLDAALRVDPDPGWANYRYFLAGLAHFCEGRLEDAVEVLEKTDMQSPEPWAKFYGVQVLLSAYGHLGRSESISIYMREFKKLLAERNYEEPNQLLTQGFFVFRNEADIDRLLGGLRKAGVPDVPTSVGLDPKDRLTGAEIRDRLFGHEMRGRQTVPEVQQYRRMISADGSTTKTIGAHTLEGKSWVQWDFLCSAYPLDLTSCSAIFRNPVGSRQQENEYLAVFRWSRVEFSLVK